MKKQSVVQIHIQRDKVFRSLLVEYVHGFGREGKADLSEVVYVGPLRPCKGYRGHSDHR